MSESRKNIRIDRRTKQREKDIEGNQWASGLLFQELPLLQPTDQSQVYVFRREQRANGDVFFIPIRATLEQLKLALNDCWDEGNAFSTYNAGDYYDEGDSTTTVVEFFYDEGDAFTIIYDCGCCDQEESVLVVNQSISTVSADTQFDSPLYYRVTGGTAFTVIEASGVFDADRPFSFRVKNVSGGNITVTRSGSDTFYTTSGSVTSTVIADGAAVQFLCGTSAQWDVI